VTAPARAGSVTIVAQTRVREGAREAFTQWQSRMSAAAAAFPGFLGQTSMPPDPPAQADWVILERFAGLEVATAWLQSSERLRLVEEAQPLLLGAVDVHLVRDGASGVLPGPVSVVISTRVKPGQEDAYRAWERRIAAAQTRFPGFQGYRFEPPIAGVQDDWLSILRFDTEDHLQAWMESPVRRQLVEEADPFTEDFHTRVVRSGFDQWFTQGGAAAASGGPPIWKQNMIVLSMLYPVVFLFGTFVQTPWLMKAAGLPFWLALFIGNVTSVLLLNVLVPRVSGLLSWWLSPSDERSTRTTLGGAALIIAFYSLCMLIFAKLS
jgi:antibiotic biosynthesis monooxygenase (ABM) superfamily enzyme